MEEYYIRKEGDEDSRGPFNLEQLSSLAEAGQVDKETFYYEVTTEQWVQINANEELTQALFPEKKKLKIKPKNEVATLNVQHEDDAPISVNDMLAAAEGKTADTKDKMDPQIGREKAALIGLRAAAVILLVSAVGLVIPNLAVIQSLDLGKIFTHPVILFGIVDLLLSVGLFLQATQLYPLVRFRAAFGIGFFAFFYWSMGEPLLLWSSVVTSVALYFCTILLSVPMVIITALVGLASVGGFDYLLLH